MKIYSNYIIDDSWIKTIEILPEEDKKVLGLYFNWKKLGDDFIQDTVFVDLIYTLDNNKPQFYKIESSKDIHNTTYTDNIHIKISYPFCWKYKD